MTKSERLQELKDQERLYKVLDRYFDAGWREFVREIWKKNDTSNFRMFKIISELRGNEFVEELIRLMKMMKSKHAVLKLTKKPKGILLNQAGFKHIPVMMVEKYPSGNYSEGAAYIELKGRHWLSFVF